MANQQVAFYSMPTQVDAQRYGLAVISFPATPAQLTQLKAWNPALRLYAYRNFEATNNTADLTTFRTNGWMLKDPTGAIIQCTDIPTEYLIDPGNSGYRAWLTAYCQARRTEGYDGVFADNFPRPRTPNKYRVGTKTIVNPRTHIAYTSDDWVNDELATLSAVKVASPIIGNGIPQAHDETGYIANQTRADRIIASNIDGLMVEGPVGWSLADFNSRSESTWKSNLNLVALILSSGKLTLFSNTGAADMETDAIANFVFCTYMLNPPSTRYSVKFRGLSYMSQPTWQNLMETSLGSYISSQYASPLYTAIYTNGKVTVNASIKTSTITITPPDPCQSYKDQITQLTAQLTAAQNQVITLTAQLTTCQQVVAGQTVTINQLNQKIEQAIKDLS